MHNFGFLNFGLSNTQAEAETAEVLCSTLLTAASKLRQPGDRNESPAASERRWSPRLAGALRQVLFPSSEQKVCAPLPADEQAHISSSIGRLSKEVQKGPGWSGSPANPHQSKITSQITVRLEIRIKAEGNTMFLITAKGKKHQTS